MHTQTGGHPPDTVRVESSTTVRGFETVVARPSGSGHWQIVIYGQPAYITVFLTLEELIGLGGAIDQALELADRTDCSNQLELVDET